MTGKTHLAVGMALGMGVAAVTRQNIPLTWLMSGVCGLGALFPDIDIPTSKLGHKAKPVSTFITKVFGHRTITHAPVLYIVLYSLASGIGFVHGMVFCAGAASHIFLDALNKKGVPVWYPLSKKNNRLACFSSHGVMDKLLLTMAVLSIILIQLYVGLAGSIMQPMSDHVQSFLYG